MTIEAGAVSPVASSDYGEVAIKNIRNIWITLQEHKLLFSNKVAPRNR